MAQSDHKTAESSESSEERGMLFVASQESAVITEPFFTGSQASMVRSTTWETEKRLILSRAGSLIASTLFFGKIAC